MLLALRNLTHDRTRFELSGTEANANGAKEALMDHHTMSEQSGEIKDPVCGMTVDAEQAKAKGLTTDHEGTTYYFCGRGCKLEFGDDPGRYLDPSHKPSM